MVEVRGVHYAAGGVRILDDVSVRFHPRRFNVILGPNGAGKSTLLRIAAGLVRPTAGEVRYGDRPIASLTPDALARTRARGAHSPRHAGLVLASTERQELQPQFLWDGGPRTKSGVTEGGSGSSHETPMVGAALLGIKGIAGAVEPLHRFHVGDAVLAQPACHHAARLLGVKADEARALGAGSP